MAKQLQKNVKLSLNQQKLIFYTFNNIITWVLEVLKRTLHTQPKWQQKTVVK
jgi:hypothetical protein